VAQVQKPGLGQLRQANYICLKETQDVMLET